MSKKIVAGARVRYSAKFLRSIGMAATPATRSVTTVRACDCAQCTRTTADRWVLTDLPADTSLYTAEELQAQPSLAYRHISVAALEAC